MPTILTTALRAGMVVSADVKNMDNMLLLPSGCTITEKHIEILEAWGVMEVQVEVGGEADDTRDPLQKFPPEVVEQWRKELKASYWNLPEDDEVQMGIFQQLLLRRARLATPR